MKVFAPNPNAVSTNGIVSRKNLGLDETWRPGRGLAPQTRQTDPPAKAVPACDDSVGMGDNELLIFRSEVADDGEARPIMRHGHRPRLGFWKHPGTFAKSRTMAVDLNMVRSETASQTQDEAGGRPT